MFRAVYFKKTGTKFKRLDESSVPFCPSVSKITIIILDFLDYLNTRKYTTSTLFKTVSHRLVTKPYHTNYIIFEPIKKEAVITIQSQSETKSAFDRIVLYHYAHYFRCTEMICLWGRYQREYWFPSSTKGVDLSMWMVTYNGLSCFLIKLSQKDPAMKTSQYTKNS